MGRTVTAQAMIDAVISRGDFFNDPHKSPTEIMSWLTAAYKELWDLLVQSGLMYTRSTQVITVDGTKANWPLAADFLAPIKVDLLFTAEVILPLREINPRLNHRYTATGARASAYECVGTDIILYPKPPAGQQYQVLYIPSAPAIVTVGQTVDVGQDGWDEYVVVGALVRGLIKSKEDTTEAENERRRQESRIVLAAQNRAIASATSLVQDDGPWGEDDYDPANWRSY